MKNDIFSNCYRARLQTSTIQKIIEIVQRIFRDRRAHYQILCSALKSPEIINFPTNKFRAPPCCDIEAKVSCRRNFLELGSSKRGDFAPNAINRIQMHLLHGSMRLRLLQYGNVGTNRPTEWLVQLFHSCHPPCRLIVNVCHECTNTQLTHIFSIEEGVVRRFKIKT